MGLSRPFVKAHAESSTWPFTVTGAEIAKPAKPTEIRTRRRENFAVTLTVFKGHPPCATKWHSRGVLRTLRRSTQLRATVVAAGWRGNTRNILETWSLRIQPAQGVEEPVAKRSRGEILAC